MHSSVESMLPLIAAAIPPIAAIVIPGSTDMLAVSGAMLATAIVTIEARRKDRSLANTITVMLGSSVTGSLTPGILFLNVWPAHAALFTWHVWAALGFVSGLIGWSAMWAITSFVKRRSDGILSAVAGRWIGCELPKPAEPPEEK